MQIYSFSFRFHTINLCFGAYLTNTLRQDNDSGKTFSIKRPVYQGDAYFLPSPNLSQTERDKFAVSPERENYRLSQ